MAETKDDISAERDALRAENDDLRRQLAAGGGVAVGRAAVRQTFQLSEGDRQELATNGVINVNGRTMNREQVEALIAERGDGSQANVEIDDPASTEAQARADKAAAGEGDAGPGIEHVDYVYPSVERGKLDPAVAGLPGVSGPAA